MTIGQRIKKRRLEMGLTVDELAEKLNKNRATVYRYESSEIENLPTTVLEPLAKALDTTPGYFMGWDNEDKSPENEKDTPTDMEREFFNKIHDLHLKPSQLDSLYEFASFTSAKDAVKK